jgi:hypothetical protein
MASFSVLKLERARLPGRNFSGRAAAHKGTSRLRSGSSRIFSSTAYELVAKARQTQGSQKKLAAASVYYDTDQIRERQEETLYLCGDCPGYFTIASEAVSFRGHYRVYCIGLPIQACPRCQKEAREHYVKMQKSPRSFDFLYLQDKAADVYRQYDYRVRKEKVYE